MSREIKFRAWVNEHWVDWLPTSKSLETYNAVIIDKDGYSTDSKCHIEQYTGLKDTNGTEIYEGDILMDGDGESFEYWVVKFEFGKFVGETVGVSEDIFELADLEVIGNIHENPELLEGDE